jgi:ABC-2 type transport system ATP-binding protein
MTTRQLLDHLGKLRGGIDTGYRDELIERFQVEPDRKIKDLSSGNKQKVGIIQAFMHKPELVILDEPPVASTLAQHATYRVIEEAWARLHRLSSHARGGASRSGSIIRNGRVIEVETVTNHKGAVRCRDPFGAPAATAAYSPVPGVTEATIADTVVRIEG